MRGKPQSKKETRKGVSRMMADIQMRKTPSFLQSERPQGPSYNQDTRSIQREQGQQVGEGASRMKTMGS
jgi:hypothetical protein